MTKDLTWPEVLKKTDWKLLCKQKDTLAHLLNYPTGLDISSCGTHLDGILNFLDAVMDAAAHELGERKVFWRRT